ncbi:MAG: hypothetical protein Q9226_003228 [Calogaya cf. arnoldii]
MHAQIKPGKTGNCEKTPLPPSLTPYFASFLKFLDKTFSPINNPHPAVHLPLSTRSTVQSLKAEAGMEALAAFSLVSGILQVLHVSFRAVTECREIYKDGSVATHRDTGDIAENLAQATSRLNASQSDSSTSPSRETFEILTLSRKCGAIAREIQVEVNKLKIDSGGYRAMLSNAIQSRRKSRWLKDTQAKLDCHTRTLDTLILTRLDARLLRRSHDLDTLDQDVRDLALKVERGVNTTARLLADQTSQILDHFDQRFDERERETEIDRARQLFQNSLFFPDIEAREDEIVDPFEGTCRWIFDPPTDQENDTPKWHSFRQWLEAGKAVYWISGKPGSGKSTLMKYIVGEPRTAQYLSEWEPDTDLIIATFFFKDLGTELQKSVTGLLRSMIWQIARYWPGMINTVLRRYAQSTGRSNDPSLLTALPTWTDRRLLQILKDFTKEKPAVVSLCAFIDGLDEYNGDEERLFEVIRLLSSAPGCKVCVSSRPDPAFRRELDSCSQCRVQDVNNKDIVKMVLDKLRPSLEKNRPTETNAINKLVGDLIEKAEGVFLWLSIMIKDLTKGSDNGDSIEELRQRLHMTPGTIYGLYRRILGGLDRSYLDYAFRTFQILIAANVSGAKILETRFLLGLSVRFIHRTAMEFLTEEYESTFNTHACLSTAWIALARANVGLMFLFPLSRRPDERYELDIYIPWRRLHEVNLYCLVEGGMMAICFGENSPRNNPKKPLGSTPSELTAQMWQTIRHLAKVDDPFGIGCRIDFEVGHDAYAYKLLLDETPLAVVQSPWLQYEDGIPSIEKLLLSVGAASRTRYKFCERNNKYYRIETSQAMELDKLLSAQGGRHTFTCESEQNEWSTETDDKLIGVLERIVATNDPLDRDMVDKECSWPEDQHEPKAQPPPPQQELTLPRRHSF